MKTSGTVINAVCPACDNHNAKFAFIKSGYSHYRCRSCGSFYVWPRPTSSELAQFYRNSRKEELMSENAWDLSESSHKHLMGHWKYLLKYSERLSGCEPLLDIGCGSGQFLAFAKEYGCKYLAGVEVVPEIAQAAQRLTGAIIYTQDFFELSLPPESFSVITVLDLIEHISDIREFLKKAFYILKPGGVIVVGTFNAKGASMRLLKEKLLIVAPPEHLILLNRRGMNEALKLEGFEVKKQWSFSIYIREYFRLLYRDKKDNDFRIFRTNASNSRVFIFLMKIADFFLNLTNLGDEFYTIAQKPFDA